MEDCTESDQSEINRKIKANDKLQKILTTVPDEHRALLYGDSFQSKMRSLDDEKKALWPRSRKSTWRDSRKTSGSSSRHIEKILQKWIEADQELESANAQQIQAKALVAEQAAENDKAVNQELPGAQPQATSSVSDNAAQQTILSVFKSCHCCERGVIGQRARLLIGRSA